jgi:hypothetical protein
VCVRVCAGKVRRQHKRSKRDEGTHQRFISFPNHLIQLVTASRRAAEQRVN